MVVRRANILWTDVMDLVVRLCGQYKSVHKCNMSPCLGDRCVWTGTGPDCIFLDITIDEGWLGEGWFVWRRSLALGVVKWWLGDHCGGQGRGHIRLNQGLHA